MGSNPSWQETSFFRLQIQVLGSKNSASLSDAENHGLEGVENWAPFVANASTPENGRKKICLAHRGQKLQARGTKNSGKIFGVASFQAINLNLKLNHFISISNLGSKCHHWIKLPEA